jgi:hypothetical protein
VGVDCWKNYGCRALERLLNVVLNVVTALSFIVWGIATYYIYAFHRLWREHMRSRGVGEFSLAFLSLFAFFWPNLPAQCKVQRRKLLVATSAFCGLLVFGSILVLTIRSQH